VDRVLVTIQNGREHLAGSLAEEIAPGVGAPVYVVPQQISPRLQGDKAAGRIMLALSLRSDSQKLLAFACRLAQEHKSHLTVVQVFSDADHGVAPFGRSPMSVASRLPLAALREAELLCRLEIVVREGDPAEEILRYQADTNQDCIILAGPRTQCAASPNRVSAVHRIVSGTQCPVILLGQSSVPARSMETMANSPKPPESATRP
jgi:nucleotide-binding universal stress UspA family protein